MKIFYCFCITFLLGFTYNSNISTVEDKLTQLFKVKVENSFNELKKLQKVLKSKNRHLIKDQYILCRKAYKECEFLIEYYDTELVNRKINAAPLPKLNKAAAQTDILEPEGFQVLDELLFSEDTSYSLYDKADEQVAILLQSFKKFLHFTTMIKVEQRHLVESIQLSLIRLTALGITGFDTPASENSIEETGIALRSVHSFLKFAAPTNADQQSFCEELRVSLLTASQFCLTHKKFDTFNRIDFIRNHIEPLYALIQEYYTKFSIEYYDEVTNKPSAVNFRNKNIFSSALFNADYYTRQHPNSNNIYKETLGKLLFFDPILSANNDRACASCHNPNFAFTDGQKTSLGFNRTGKLLRNSPTLINAIFAEKFFYDLRASSFEDQVQHVVTNAQEFHTDFSAIIHKIQSSEEYSDLFAKAFSEIKDNSKISPYTISSALAAYQKTLHSFNSPVDQYLRGENVVLSQQVKNGFNLFMGKAACGTCHFAPTFAGLVPPRFTETESEVLGVTETSDLSHPHLDNDAGRYGARTKETVNMYRNSFKTMTVRNIALTAPYFHNGAFATLEQVIDFYDRGGGSGLGLHVPNQTLSDEKLNLTKKEKIEIVAFLKALTDTTGLTSKPLKLPTFSNSTLNHRTLGGLY